jgi:hypothetical protein
VRRLVFNVMALGSAWKVAPPPMKFGAWVVAALLAAGLFKVAHILGVAPPLDVRNMMSFTRAWL